MSEKSHRQYQRFCLCLPVRVRLQVGHRESSLVEETFTENLGRGGCYFLLSNKPPVGAELQLEIAFPPLQEGLSGSTVHCRGKVVRVEDTAGGRRVGIASTIDEYSFAREQSAAA